MNKLILYILIFAFFSCNSETDDFRNSKKANIEDITNVKTDTNEKVEKGEDTCLKYFKEIIRLRDTSIIITAKKSGCNLNKSFKYEKSNTSLLIESIQNKYFDILSTLLEQGANPNDTSVVNYPAFAYSLRKNADDNILALLVKYGADVNFYFKDAIEYRVPLDIVVRNKDIKKAKILLRNGANPDGAYTGQIDDLYVPPLVAATMRQDLEMFNLLLSRSADCNVVFSDESGDCWTCPNGITPLHSVVVNYGVDTLIQQKILSGLLDCSENINLKSIDGLTPLDFASYTSDLRSIEFLISNGAIINDDDRSALIHASYFSNYSVIELLLERGADPNYKDRNGYTPSHVLLECCGDGFGESIKLIDRVKSLKILHRYGANFKITNSSGKSVLDLLEYRTKVKDKLEDENIL